MNPRQFAVVLGCSLLAGQTLAANCESFSYYRGVHLDLPAEQMGFGKLDKPAESEAVYRLERDASCRPKELVYLLGQKEVESALHLFTRISFRYPNGTPEVEQRWTFSQTSPTQVPSVTLYKRNAKGQAVSAVLLKDYMINRFEFEYAGAGELKSVSESGFSIDHFVKRKKREGFEFGRDGSLSSYLLRQSFAPERVTKIAFDYDRRGLVEQWTEKNSNEDYEARRMQYEYDSQGALLQKKIKARRDDDRACYSESFRYENARLKEISRSKGCSPDAVKTAVVNRFVYAADGTIRKWVDDISDSFEKVLYTSLFDERGRILTDTGVASSERATRRSQTHYTYDARGSLTESRYETQTSGTEEKDERVTQYRYSDSRFLGIEENSKTVTLAGKLKKHEQIRITQKPDGTYVLQYKIIFAENGASEDASTPLN